MKRYEYGKESAYAEAAWKLLLELEAEGIVLVVFGGKHGNGAAGQFTSFQSLTAPRIATMLRHMGKDIEANPTAYISSVTTFEKPDKPH